jgi:hypothetical protein
MWCAATVGRCRETAFTMLLLPEIQQRPIGGWVFQNGVDAYARLSSWLDACMYDDTTTGL